MSNENEVIDAMKLSSDSETTEAGYDWSYITDHGGPTIEEVVRQAFENPDLKTLRIVNDRSVFDCRISRSTQDSCELEWFRFSHKEQVA